MTDEQRRPHFLLSGHITTEPFRPPRTQGRASRVASVDRQAHGTHLKGQFKELEVEMASAKEAAAGVETPGLLIEFESFPGIELAFESLDRSRSGIELRNVRKLEETTYATVFVPDGKLEIFERLLEDYLGDRRSKDNERSLDHKALINTIKNARRATLEALWTDVGAFPALERAQIWWEVWLPRGHVAHSSDNAFRALAAELGLRVAKGELRFPERVVLLVRASPEELKRSPRLLDQIAELRGAKETAEFFDALPAAEQESWTNELLSRTNYPNQDLATPHVCLLDTGVNRGHPLLAPALANEDLHTIEPAWGTADGEQGHGTQMAGLALLGDLVDLLQISDPVTVRTRLESVKLLDRDGGNVGDPSLHGHLTVEAVARPEIVAPDRPRVFGLTITAKDGRDRGRPSAWSAAVDGLAADTGGDGTSRRLIVVSAGNASDPSAYPAGNSTDGIHDPGQAWNALTVGAFTEKAQLTEPGAENSRPMADPGALSPYTTTSSTWQPQWPMKPDVVLEGGNRAVDGTGDVQTASLSLLTTHHVPSERAFTTAWATSASCALAARMAAEIMAEYPSLRPETTRALIVQSARWTDAMRQAHLPSPSTVPQKRHYHSLVRHCGFGVPDLSRALWSASNSLVLVAEATIAPFEAEKRGDIRLKEMQLHKLPWPLTELEALGETNVEMRVTLSYFIEPNPSARGHKSRYRYESHGLRFDVKRAEESESDFRSRINSAARAEEQEVPDTAGEDPNWLIGKNNRHRGSLHSDIWRGTAVDLASRGVVGVYPAAGWWKTRKALQRWDSRVPYTLLVSIHAPEVDVDLYTAIQNRIPLPIEVRVS